MDVDLGDVEVVGEDHQIGVAARLDGASGAVEPEHPGRNE